MRRHRLTLATFVALAPLALAGTADADGRARPRKPRPAAAGPDLAAAVATGDPQVQCRAAIAAVAAGQHARASFVLPACDAAIAAAPELEAPARKARIAVAGVARTQDWSPVELVLRPAGAEATLAIDAFAGLPVAEGRVLLPAGRYRITARNGHGEVSYQLAIGEGSRAMVLLELPTMTAAPVHGVVDFGDGEPAPAALTGPPPKIRRGSLLPERFRRGLDRRPARPQ